MATAMIIVQMLRGTHPCNGVHDCPPLENALVVIVGGIPIAMPTVLSVTMATGAFKYETTGIFFVVIWFERCLVQVGPKEGNCGETYSCGRIGWNGRALLG